jgi:hypothetical protein
MMPGQFRGRKRFSAVGLKRIMWGEEREFRHSFRSIGYTGIWSQKRNRAHHSSHEPPSILIMSVEYE